MLGKEESELLSAFLDKELRGEKLALVHERLASAPEWRAEMEKLKRSKSLLTGLPHLSAPIDLLDQLEELARAQSNKRFTFFWESIEWAQFWNPWVMSGSAVAAAAILAVVLVHRSPSVDDTIPLEALVAAHVQGQSQALLSQNIWAASEYSSQFKHHASS